MTPKVATADGFHHGPFDSGHSVTHPPRPHRRPPGDTTYGKQGIGRHIWLWVVPVLLHPVADPDPRLLEAIDWYTGVAGSVDDVKARKLLLEVVGDTGSALSRMWVARCHSRGRMGFERDGALARGLARDVIHVIRKMALLGEPEAAFLMGTAFDEGLGEREDPSAAADFFRQAAGVGHVLSQHNLGNLYAAGRGLEEDPALAVRWWTLAAEQGDAITQLRLGEAYEAGSGVERHMATAVRWYREAAERGNKAAREALVRLGR